MNLIVKILLSVVVLIVIVLIVALFAKKDYTITREITVNKSRAIVFDYIKYLKNQDAYSKWATMDPHMKKEYKGTDGTAGFTSAWDSNDSKVGKGEQQIVKINEGNGFDFSIHFIKPFEGLATGYMGTEAVAANQTKVTWVLSSSMKYPMNTMLWFMDMDKMIGDDLQIGLTNLKGILEKN